MAGRDAGEFVGLALLCGYRGESCHQLVHALAAAVRTLDFSFLDVGDEEALGEFLVAVLAVIEVLRHDATPCHIIAPETVDGG
jgi:hypothetical protein